MQLTNFLLKKEKDNLWLTMPENFLENVKGCGLISICNKVEWLRSYGLLKQELWTGASV